MNNQNSDKIINEYTVSSDGKYLMRRLSDENDNRVSVSNIMLSSGEWDNDKLKVYFLDCINETEETGEILYDEDWKEPLANFLVAVFRFTEADAQTAKKEFRWKEFLKNSRKFSRDPDRLIEGGEVMATILPFLYLQFSAVKSVSLEKIRLITKDSKRIFWSHLKAQSVLCVREMESWIHNNSSDLEFAESPEREGLVGECRDFLKKWDPERIQAYLDEYISGQEIAKVEFAHICYEHIARIANPELKIRKSNYVMFGPTGSGKTELCRVIKKILPVPVEIIDASVITSNGFKGPDKEDIMFELMNTAKDIECGIIVMDEFDKLCMPSYDSHGSNVNKLIQGELLKMIEGTVLYSSKGYSSSELNTENITFICAGAFEGAFVKEIKNGFGFGSEDVDLNAGKSVTDCLEEFGMIPELAGRICSAIPLGKLEENDLYEILQSKKNNCIENIRKLYKAAYDSEIEFSEDALREICRKAALNGLGARGLSGIVENVCHANRARMSGKEKRVLRITEDMVKKAYTY